MEERTICVKLYCNAHEYEALNELKAAFGLSHSAILRMLTLNEVSILRRKADSPAMGLVKDWRA